MKIKLLLILLFPLLCYSQIKFKEPALVINHNELTLWLDSDYNSFVTKHEIKYSDFLKLDSDRDDRWHNEIHKGPYSKEPYLYSGYDLGHLTPSHITSYNDTLNHHSFSFYNQAPQLAHFNRGKWARLERGVEDSIYKYKSDAVIITGVIYDNNKKNYLGKSKIKIPYSFYKILYIQKNKLTYVWIGSNTNGEILIIDIKTLNDLLKLYKNDISYTKK